MTDGLLIAKPRAKTDAREMRAWLIRQIAPHSRDPQPREIRLLIDGDTTRLQQKWIGELGEVWLDVPYSVASGD